MRLTVSAGRAPRFFAEYAREIELVFAVLFQVAGNVGADDLRQAIGDSVIVGTLFGNDAVDHLHKLKHRTVAVVDEVHGRHKPRLYA